MLFRSGPEGNREFCEVRVNDAVWAYNEPGTFGNINFDKGTSITSIETYYSTAEGVPQDTNGYRYQIGRCSGYCNDDWTGTTEPLVCLNGTPCRDVSTFEA